MPGAHVRRIARLKAAGNDAWTELPTPEGVARIRNEALFTEFFGLLGGAGLALPPEVSAVLARTNLDHADPDVLALVVQAARGALVIEAPTESPDEPGGPDRAQPSPGKASGV